MRAIKGTGSGAQLGHLDERRGNDECLVCWHVGNMLTLTTDSWGLKSTLLSNEKNQVPTEHKHNLFEHSPS